MPSRSKDQPQYQATARLHEGGQGLIEYAFILVLIALLLIVSVGVLGHSTSNLYSNVSNGLAN